MLSVRAPKIESDRIAVLRRSLVEDIGEGLDPHRHSLGDLIHRYLKHWRRQIPSTKRRVVFVERFWDGELVTRHLDKIFDLVRIIESGENLSPYLSRRANRAVIHPRDNKHDGDFALAAYDVHHLHFDPIDPTGPRKVRQKDKEDALLFGTFGDDSAVLIMVGTHKSFHDGTLEEAVVLAREKANHMVINGILGERNLTALDRTKMGLRGLNTTAHINGRAVMSSLVTCSGSSIRTLRMADFAAWRIADVDPILDDVQRAQALLGDRVPDAPVFSWRFDHTRLVLFEEVNGTAFTFADQAG